MRVVDGGVAGGGVGVRIGVEGAVLLSECRLVSRKSGLLSGQLGILISASPFALSVSFRTFSKLPGETALTKWA